MTGAMAQASVENGSVRISLSGEIDRANVAAVEEEIHAAVSGQLAEVSVDLTDVTYIDSAGKRLLFDLASSLHESHIVLELIVPFDSPTRRLIELSGLHTLAALSLMGRQHSSEVGPLELMLPAQPWSLKNIRNAMRRWLLAVSADPRAVSDLLIAVGEACTNVVDHAYGADGGIVAVHLELQFSSVVATIADTGRWGVPPGGNRGRGTLFMRHCSDDLRIDHSPAGTTVVIRRDLIEEAS
ncbi:MAG: ATP-binding protein [Actinomycetota bacterium]|jgi:anti-anti-sigma factor|nr:ATP-binding protein [Actinomycetota bacterium]MDQ3905538.1 ATP-binding protein [Actinomycetota bacterium]